MNNKNVVFQTNLIKTDITTLKIVKEKYLLIGSGNTISVYEDLKTLVHKFSVFVGQKVHGIVVNEYESKIIIFGGKQACLYNTKDIIAEKNTLLNKIHCNDWILSMLWRTNENEIALLTAHNVVQIWNTISGKILSSHKCDENCILYSGILLNISDNLLVMGGTVFSQVIIWDIKSETVSNRLIGHKGVIFSISCSEDKETIVTTSDDRSVKVWKMKDKSLSKNSSEYWTSDGLVDSSVTLFGHSARVMRALVNNNIIVSIGEDSALCVWDTNGTLLLKKKITKGGTLWSLDCDFTKNIAVIGGSDSSITICSIDSKFEEADIRLLKFGDEKLQAKKAIITARGNIVCLTECGMLMYFSFEDSEWTKQETGILHFQYLSLSTCQQLIAVSTIDGHLQVFAETCKYKAKLVNLVDQKLLEEMKIMSMHWIRNRMLAVCNDNGVITIWGLQGEKCAIIFSFILPPCKERWLTAATSFSTPDFLFVAGDRHSNLHVYEKKSQSPSYSMSKIHGRLGINSIHTTEDGLFTAGRDGTIKYFYLKKKTHYYLESAYYIGTPFKWVERFLDGSRQFICGFKGTNFILWNAKYQTEMIDIDCGGGHRSWDITRKWFDNGKSVANSIRLIFVKNSFVNCYDFDMDKIYAEPIAESFHTSETNCMKVLTFDKYTYIITGGEDTTLNINALHCNTSSMMLERKMIFAKHLSNVRCMSYSKFSFNDTKETDESFILFTAGGRAQILTWKIILSKSQADPILKVTDFGNYTFQGGPYSTKKMKSDCDISETRIMSIKFVPGENKNTNNLLIAGCSDGQLMIYSYVKDAASEEYLLNLRSSSTLDKKCILNIHSFHYKTDLIVSTMSVNGMLAFWNLNHSIEINLIYEMKIHKAGFNSFEFHFIDEEVFVLISGGDDNTISLNVFRISMSSENIKIERISFYNCENIHSCQITGIKLLGTDHFITTSIDQRCTILRWYYDKQNNEIKCDFISQYVSSVSDVQGIEIIGKDKNLHRLAVYGKGMEVFSFEL